MRFKRIPDALEGLGLPVCRFQAGAVKPPYLVYAEDGAGDTVHTDDGVAARVIQGTVDYFTREPDDLAPQQVEAALDAAGAAWRLNSLQREEKTHIIHWEWVVEEDE